MGADTCASCEYFKPGAVPETDPGLCRYLPPQVVVIADVASGAWPTCLPTDWCSEHRSNIPLSQFE